MIELEEVSKFYGRNKTPAVEGLSFTVKNGEILGFAGLNGAGKTTAINCMAGILLPTRGRILIDGMDIVTRKPEASVNIGWVSEFPAFEYNVRPGELLKYFAGFYNISGQEAEQRITRILRIVGLENAVDRKINVYSQGMKKRLGLAAAMISDPHNYLLDEILNGLDPGGVRSVKEQMLEFRKDGKTVLLSTHILGALGDIADRIVIIHRGTVREIISREKFRSLGKPVISLKTDVVDEKLMKILESFGSPVPDGDRINILGTSGNEDILKEINLALVKAGYGVSHISTEGSSLEQYFLNVTGADE